MKHSITINRAYQADTTRLLAAILELLTYLIAIGLGVFCFLMGWIGIDAAAVLTLLLVIALICRSWNQFDCGRHPCFFFLCTLAVFQAGRVMVPGGEATGLFRVTLMTSSQFDVSQEVAATALLAIALSAVAIYSPCRWNYRALPRPKIESLTPFLTYLYWLLYCTLPVQLFKNYRYYQYAQEHGGYLAFFVDHGGLASNIPMAVRAVSLISLPALVGIFVLERRKKFLYPAVTAYFIIAAPVLLIGSRGGIFSLILSLWYVAKIKSEQPGRLSTFAFLGIGLALLGALVGGFRNKESQSTILAVPSQFVEEQGISLDVTEVAIAFRQRFTPHIASYLLSEIESAFVADDQTNYVGGKRFADDVAFFLNPVAYQLGFGSGSSYLAEAYVFGGLWGVVLISLLLGLGLRGMHAHSENPLVLFVVAMILPDVLWMARGGLLGWLSALVRVGISGSLMIVGWWGYKSAVSIGGVLWRNGCRQEAGRLAPSGQYP
jgi:hypothetical protein